jgi:hypothetical protein
MHTAHLNHYSANQTKGPIVTPDAEHAHSDQDMHKGAIEGDRPSDEQFGNENATGLDENGMPDDPIAIAEDVIGANEDESRG